MLGVGKVRWGLEREGTGGLVVLEFQVLGFVSSDLFFRGAEIAHSFLPALRSHWVLRNVWEGWCELAFWLEYSGSD